MWVVYYNFVFDSIWFNQ